MRKKASKASTGSHREHDKPTRESKIEAKMVGRQKEKEREREKET